MHSQLSTAGARGFVVGLSGGIDSAVVARLAQMAAPGALLGMLLPCHSDPEDERHGLAVAEHYAVMTSRVDLSPAYDALVADTRAALCVRPKQARNVAPSDLLRGRVPLADIKPRLRMATLYFVANSINYLVAGTGIDPRSQSATSQSTKTGAPTCC